MPHATCSARAAVACRAAALLVVWGVALEVTKPIEDLPNRGVHVTSEGAVAPLFNQVERGGSPTTHRLSAVSCWCHDRHDGIDKLTTYDVRRRGLRHAR